MKWWKLSSIANLMGIPCPMNGIHPPQEHVPVTARMTSASPKRTSKRERQRLKKHKRRHI